MKKVLRFTAVMALLLVTSWAMANGPQPLLVSSDKEKALVIKWDAPFKMTTVRILDSYENVIFSDNLVKKNKHALKFNLENLERGNYSLKIENSNKIIEYRIQINGDDVEILDKKEISKPFFIHKDKKLFFNLLNADGALVYLKIYDSENRMVYGETLKGNSIGKAINFETSYKDSYTVVLIDDNTTYSEQVVVE